MGSQEEHELMNDLQSLGCAPTEIEAGFSVASAD